MDQPTATALLEGLHDPRDEAAWREFDARFRPILEGFARRFGFGDSDAGDVAQETIVRFIRAYRAGRYSRERGRLGDWLIGIARHCAVDVCRRRGREEVLAASRLADEPDARRLTEAWEGECRRHLLDSALTILRERHGADPRTVRAFEMIAFHDLAPAAVAAELGMSVNAVYIAKNRCLSRLRAIIRELIETITDLEGGNHE